MTTLFPRLLLKSVLVGIAAEGVALLVSFGLYSLKVGREPMEPPFNWTATMLQAPGVFICDGLSLELFAIQAALWSIVAFAILVVRARKIA